MPKLEIETTLVVDFLTMTATEVPVIADARLVTIPSENRTVVLPEEDRTVELGADE